MSRSEQVWQGSDVPYFGAPAGSRSGTGGTFLRFADRTSPTARRVAAVLFGVAAIVAGVAVTGILLFMALVLEFGSPPNGADLALALAFGAPVAIGGLILAVIAYRHAGAPTGMTVGAENLTIAYPSFSRPLVIPRTAVRAIAIDDGSDPLGDRERFPVRGDLPDDVFVDALDIPSAGLLGDLDSARRGRVDPTPGVIWERPETPSHGDPYRHDDPQRPGWAAGDSAPRPRFRRGFLFNRHGHSVPFLRSDVTDVPNVAVVFLHPIRIPRPAWWSGIAPGSARAAHYRGGHEARGILVHVVDATAARRALEPWQVVREITAEDVTEQGLLLAKPLVGWRTAVFALLLFGPMIMGLVLRALR